MHWNLSRDSWSSPGPGHVMKLRYTSLQADVGSAEEALSGEPPSLPGTPVVVCQLHSQVACVAAAFKHIAPSRSLVLVMTDWGALPVVLSDLLADLRRAALIDAVVSAGEAFGGDHEAVNVVSGMHVAAAVAGADAIVVGPGPGVVGTGTALGFAALEAAAILDAAAELGGRPIMCVRFSEADTRHRHLGVSHHTRAALERTHCSPTAAVPVGEARFDERAITVEVPDVSALLEASGIEARSMGRGPEDDSGFFRYAAAAGVAATEALEGRLS